LFESTHVVGGLTIWLQIGFQPYMSRGASPEPNEELEFLCHDVSRPMAGPDKTKSIYKSKQNDSNHSANFYGV